MARRGGGNVLRTPDKTMSTAVPNTPDALLNLLKTYPGIFGSLPNKEVRELRPAILFNGVNRIECFAGIPSLLVRPFAHKKLEGQVTESKILPAYAVLNDSQKVIYPRASEVGDFFVSEVSTEEGLDRLRTRFMGTAAVEVGGIESESSSVDLVTLVIAGRELLAKSNHSGLDFMKTQEKFRELVEGILGERA